jgi:hypothetical protein
MTLSNLTTRLNVKAICIISAVMLFFAIYNHWISYQERRATAAQNMEMLTAYLASAIPAELLLVTGEQANGGGSPPEKQLLVMNNKL